MTTIASGIIELRRELGLTQPEFADLLGVSFRSLCRYEAGRPLAPSAVAKLVALAKKKKFEHLATLFRAFQEAEIASRLNNLSSAGSPRRITATELAQWTTSLTTAIFGLRSVLGTQQEKMDQGAVWSCVENLNVIEDVRNYISSYTGSDEEASIVRPFGAWIQATEAIKNPPPKVPKKRGRPSAKKGGL